MAFKHVTSGLTNVNSVIDEIITFVTVDLPAPWTLVHNLRPTAGAGNNDFPTSAALRFMMISKTPSQDRVTGPNGGAAQSPYIGSPVPDEMFMYFTGATFGPQFSGGQIDAATVQSPVQVIPPFNLGMDGLICQRVANDNRNSIGINATESLQPATSMYLFGPEQTSPENPLIPNYVYFVIEFSAGRYGHGFFGEWKKMVPFPGGWGNAGSHRDGSDNIESSLNSTMWNEQSLDARKKNWLSVNGFWDNTPGTSDNSQGLSPKPVPTWAGDHDSFNNNGIADDPVPLKQYGHGFFRDLMVYRATLSGFQPLATPFNALGDWFDNGVNIDDPGQDFMPAIYLEDFFVARINEFEPGVQIDIGGIPIIPFPVTSKLGGTPSSNFGAYCYRVRT